MNPDCGLSFPGGKRKALTFSFDDGEHYDRRLAALLRGYGLKATFYLVTGDLGKEIPHFRYGAATVVRKVAAGELKETYQGMEVASHTAEHRAVVGEMRETVLGSMAYLQDLLGYEVTGMAYPGGQPGIDYGESHIRELESLGVLYARTACFTNTFGLPERLLEWHPTCHYCADNIGALVRAFAESPGAGQEEPLKLFHIMGHSYELEQPDERGQWAAFGKLCAALSARDDVWYATNGEIAAWLATARQNQGRSASTP